MNTPHLIEIALLMLAAFLIGCLIGYFLRRLIGRDGAAQSPSSEAAQMSSATSANVNQAPATEQQTPKTVQKAAASKTTTSQPAEAKSDVNAKTVNAKTKASAKPKTTASAEPKTKAKSATTAKRKTTTKSSTAKSAASKTTATKTQAAKATPKKAAVKPSAKSNSTSASDGKPETLAAPRNGKGDDLKRIKGVGPKIEDTLNKLGIYHFDQVASWGRNEVKWVDEQLSFKGRIDRENWIPQAKQLAKEG